MYETKNRQYQFYKPRPVDPVYVETEFFTTRSRTILKAAVIHPNLNSPGGERIVAIEVMQSLAELGYDVDLVTIQKPNLEELTLACGKKIAVTKIKSFFPVKIRSFGIYQRLLSVLQTLRLKDNDLVFNTSGPILPYKLTRSVPTIIYVHGPALAAVPNIKYETSLFWRVYSKPYKILADKLERSAVSKANIVIANSKFTSDSLVKEYNDVEPILLYPPVDIDRFSQAYGSDSSSRNPQVLILSRFSPEKQIENVIQIARLVDNDIEFRIIGSLLPGSRHYFRALCKLIKDYSLENRLKLIPNASSEEIITSMSSSRVYLHPAFGEPLGIAIIEAMAAGLVPIVPSYGGCSEIVPSNYLYSTIREASRLVSKNIAEYNDSVRMQFHRTATEFSAVKFRESLKGFVNTLSV
jgi:glycosyltransferase involved in cell wall biosynthesis